MADLRQELQDELAAIRAAGTYKHERRLTSSQGPHVRTSTPAGEAAALNFCTNDYLGLASHPEVVAAAK